MGSSLIDEIECGNFFDQIDDLIEFPPENECADGGDLVSSGDYPTMWNDVLPYSDTIFSGGLDNAADDLSAELSVPYEDIVQLEWLSTFVEDSFSGGGMTIGKENLCINTGPSHNKFHISSPVSILESSSTSSSSSAEKTTPLGTNHRAQQRPRSKRPRPATFSPRAPIHLISPSSGPEQKKKKKNKIKLYTEPIEMKCEDPPVQPVRKCMHCEITKTPQWRAGPMGPKTLCNACGVRHKSGRLFPEYRPAASPTFVPSLHSSSHKKVVEMRAKAGPTTATTTPTVAKPENVPSP